MTDASQNFRRRYMQPLPSRRKHILLVACCLAVIFGSLSIFTNFLGSSEDAKSVGKLAIAPPPLPPESDTLAASSDALPDLLAGDVPDKVNPTETLSKITEVQNITTDALGNPINSPNSSPATSIELFQGPAQSAVSFPRSNSPQVITIDGKPINGQSAALVPAPISGLTALGPYGQVPAISSSGVTPHSAYKHPFSLNSGKTTVSIIIGGLGVNRAITQQAIDDLPSEVTLSFAAHSSGLQGWVNKARAKGHEVLIEVPLESNQFDTSEPGADRALRVEKNTSSNPRNLAWLLSRAQGAFGVTNYNGDKFLNRADAVAPLFEKLSQMGLSFVFDGSVSAPSLSAISSSAKLPYASGFNLIDATPEPNIISSELSRLSDYAVQGAGPIGVGFAYAETIVAVQSWARNLESQGLILAPASSALK